MSPLLGALILTLLGIAGARVSFRLSRAALGPRLLFSAGTHFLFLGFLLGSNVLGLLSRGVIDQLYPFLALGLGWIGLLFGLQLDRRHLRRFPRAYLLVALLQAALAFLLFLALGALPLAALGHATPAGRLGLAAAAATACVSTPAGIALVSQALGARGRVTRLLFFVASLDALVGIVALQITYASYRPFPAGLDPDLPAALGWLALAIGLGVASGLLFLGLTRPRPDREEAVLFLLGLVVFASGTALYLGLSPLFVTAVAGAVVGNLSALRRRVFAVLESWEKPIYVILLILAGAVLRFPSWLIVPLAAGYIFLRGVAKLAAAELAARLAGVRLAPPGRLGTGLIPQGGISLAMAIGIALAYGGVEINGLGVVDLLFSTVVLGVIASELVGPLMIRDLLRRSGELGRTDGPARGSPAATGVETTAHSEAGG